MFNLEITLVVIPALFAAALVGVYVRSRHAKHKMPDTSSAAQTNRWVVLEIERKDTAENGRLWEVHDDWELRDHREAAQ
jgi:hypothetical protein